MTSTCFSYHHSSKSLRGRPGVASLCACGLLLPRLLLTGPGDIDNPIGDFDVPGLGGEEANCPAGDLEDEVSRQVARK